MNLPSRHFIESVVDYLQLLLLVSNDYMNAMQKKMDHQDVVWREVERCYIKVQQCHLVKDLEKAKNDIAKAEPQAEKQTQIPFKA